MSMNNKKKRNCENNDILLWVFVFIVFYTAAEIIIGFVAMRLGVESPIDSSLTSEVFSFAKLVIASGAAITVKNKVKK